ncbi:hypothetical protein C8261_14765 [Pseudothauera lacus]|uniref:Uncharacterized protein n=1 Tax=Pseudothauera lacus TaxID=2136175 RepID=A0A2T4ICM3_9RHOO|nr:hypothetical protein C8261_14765 [Pseudothauera lacus]
MLRDSSLHADLNYSNRPVRARMPGGVGGAEPHGSPLSRLPPCGRAQSPGPSQPRRRMVAGPLPMPVRYSLSARQ